MLLIPETPRWYVSRGREERARRALQWLRGKQADVEPELKGIVKSHCEAERHASQNAIFDLLKRSNLKPLAISLGLMFFQQLSGINAVIFYTVSIFKDAGSTIDENLCTIIVGVVNFMATFIATILIDRLGRKKLLYISDVAMIITLMTLGTFFYYKNTGADISNIGWLPLGAFVIFVLGFSLGFGPIVSTNFLWTNFILPHLFSALVDDGYVNFGSYNYEKINLRVKKIFFSNFYLLFFIFFSYLGEILPGKIRGSAASVATAFNWACTFVVTKTFADIIGEYIELCSNEFQLTFKCFQPLSEIMALSGSLEPFVVLVWSLWWVNWRILPRLKCHKVMPSDSRYSVFRKHRENLLKILKEKWWDRSDECHQLQIFAQWVSICNIETTPLIYELFWKRWKI